MDRKEFITISKATAREFIKDDVGYLAAALTYYAFFSLFPAVLLAALITAFFVKPEDAYGFIFAEVGQFAPGLVKFLSESLKKVIESRSTAGWSALIGSVVLIFTSTGAFEALDKAINRAWNAERVPSFFKGKLVGFFMMLAVGALLLLSVSVSVGLTSARSFTTYYIGEPLFSQIVWTIVNLAASTGIIFLGFLFMYRYIPRRAIGFRDVYVGAFFAALVWSAAKELFALYLGSSFVNYSAVYGTVGTIIALLTWFYVSSLIVLTGAEFASETARVRSLRAKVFAKPSEPRRSPWLRGLSGGSKEP